MGKIDHKHRAGRLWPILINAAKERKLIGYKDAGDAIQVHHRPIRYALGPIQRYCLDEGLPRLTALVVNKTTGLQGGGFAGAPGDKADLEEAWAFDWETVPNPFSTLREVELDAIAQELLSDPEEAPDRLVLTLSRGDAQRVFRTAVLIAYDHKCAFCGIGFQEVLEAAHIVPWASAKASLRIDPRNGLCLCANHHRLFDANLISIDDDLRIRYYDPNMEDGEYGTADQAMTVSCHDKKVRLPKDRKLRPLKEHLRSRARE